MALFWNKVYTGLKQKPLPFYFFNYFFLEGHLRNQFSWGSYDTRCVTVWQLCYTDKAISLISHTHLLAIYIYIYMSKFIDYMLNWYGYCTSVNDNPIKKKRCYNTARGCGWGLSKILYEGKTDLCLLYLEAHILEVALRQVRWTMLLLTSRLISRQQQRRPYCSFSLSTTSPRCRQVRRARFWLRAYFHSASINLWLMEFHFFRTFSSASRYYWSWMFFQDV